MARGAWWVTVNRVTRVRQDLVTKLPSPKTYKTNISLDKEMATSSVFLLGKFHGERTLASYSP